MFNTTHVGCKRPRICRAVTCLPFLIFPVTVPSGEQPLGSSSIPLIAIPNRSSVEWWLVRNGQGSFVLDAVGAAALISRTLWELDMLAAATSEPTSFPYHDLEIVTFYTIRTADDFIHGHLLHDLFRKLSQVKTEHESSTRQNRKQKKESENDRCGRANFGKACSLHI